MIRLRETITGKWVVEKLEVKWSLFGLKKKWIPYVKTSSIMKTALLHDKKSDAINNASIRLIKDLSIENSNLNICQHCKNKI